MKLMFIGAGLTSLLVSACADRDWAAETGAAARLTLANGTIVQEGGVYPHPGGGRAFRDRFLVDEDLERNLVWVKTKFVSLGAGANDRTLEVEATLEDSPLEVNNAYRDGVWASKFLELVLTHGDASSGQLGQLRPLAPGCAFPTSPVAGANGAIETFRATATIDLRERCFPQGDGSCRSFEECGVTERAPVFAALVVGRIVDWRSTLREAHYRLDLATDGADPGEQASTDQGGCSVPQIDQALGLCAALCLPSSGCASSRGFVSCHPDPEAGFVAPCAWQCEAGMDCGRTVSGNDAVAAACSCDEDCWEDGSCCVECAGQAEECFCDETCWERDDCCGDCPFE